MTWRNVIAVGMLGCVALTLVYVGLCWYIKHHCCRNGQLVVFEGNIIGAAIDDGWSVGEVDFGRAPLVHAGFDALPVHWRMANVHYQRLDILGSFTHAGLNYTFALHVVPPDEDESYIGPVCFSGVDVHLEAEGFFRLPVQYWQMSKNPPLAMVDQICDAWSACIVRDGE